MGNIPEHIAIIMDGNRRWAKKHLLQIALGHVHGADNLERIADACLELGIQYLTVYTFSTENWKRSAEEVSSLMSLFVKEINDFDARIKNRDIRFRFLGDIGRFSKEIQEGFHQIEEKTKSKTSLVLNFAVNYGGRAEMIYATKKIAREVLEGRLKIEDISEDTIRQNLQILGSPDPDLVIRTGGEQRLSGFLLWQSAYSELYFTDVLWPDFDEVELKKAIEEFQHRKRNFGK